MDYRERLTWVNFIPSCVFTLYWTVLFVRTRDGGPTSAMNFSLSLIALVISQAVGSGLVAALSRREPADERERRFAERSYKVAYWTLFWGAVLWGCIFYQGRQPVPASTGFGLLLLLFCVELVRSGSILLSYRSGSRP